jgi:hypothetical protein
MGRNKYKFRVKLNPTYVPNLTRYPSNTTLNTTHTHTPDITT